MLGVYQPPSDNSIVRMYFDEEGYIDGMQLL